MLISESDMTRQQIDDDWTTHRFKLSKHQSPHSRIKVPLILYFLHLRY